MKNWRILFAVTLVPVLGSAMVHAFEDKVPSTKEIMTKLHKGGNAQFKKLETATKTKPTDWTTLKKSTAEFAVLAGALGKNQPPKGDKASWTKQTSTYLETAKEMEKAAEAEDLATLEASEKKLGASCKACHNVHRGR